MKMRSCLAVISKALRTTSSLSFLHTSSRHSSVPHGSRAAIIDGKSMANEIKQEIAKEVAIMKEQVGKIPGLAVIVVGSQRSSELYVHNKTLACAETGMSSTCVKLPEDVCEEHIIAAIQKYNEDPFTHGILVQLPLPKIIWDYRGKFRDSAPSVRAGNGIHLDEEKILGAIKLEKDVDGCHPLNIANLALQGKEPLFVPCTAKACLKLLLDSDVPLSGKYAVVIGCGNIAGLPISLMLQNHNATVTRVHILTEGPEKYTQDADIVISAAGCPNLVRANWLKPDAVVLDVGINHILCPLSGDLQLVGDVCVSEACKVASLISPVPGGVGPVTIAMLLQNTVKAAKMMYTL